MLSISRNFKPAKNIIFIRTLIKMFEISLNSLFYVNWNFCDAIY